MILCAGLLSASSAPAGRRGRFYSSALVSLTAADKATKRGDAVTANGRLDVGLRTLGSHYFTPETIDDSEMHLLLARQADAKGRTKQAVAIRRDVLSIRLQMCSMGPGQR